MTRDISTSLRDQMAARVNLPIGFFEGLFDSGALRLWTGYDTISWNGVEWTGAGHLIGLSEIAESQELRAIGASATLSGIPSDFISLALSEDYQGRRCNFYIGAMSIGQIVADPILLFGGTADVMEIDDSGEYGSITITIESRLIDLERPREHRYEHEDQQAIYPGDLGLEYVPTIQDQPIIWGRS
jgi:hypothetical protein